MKEPITIKLKPSIKVDQVVDAIRQEFKFINIQSKLNSYGITFKTPKSYRTLSVSVTNINGQYFVSGLTLTNYGGAKKILSTIINASGGVIGE